jgi:hypothetical protein
LNIFAVASDPWVAARSLGDRHVVKMTTETAQIMCSIFQPGEAPYKRTHYNHPCVVWSRTNSWNYYWLFMHGRALASEYTTRYGKTHKSAAVIEWCWLNVRSYMFLSPGEAYLSDFAQAMPEQYMQEDPEMAVMAYRAYYRTAKAHLHQYTKRSPPRWLIDPTDMCDPLPIGQLMHRFRRRDPSAL